MVEVALLVMLALALACMREQARTIETQAEHIKLLRENSK